MTTRTRTVWFALFLGLVFVCGSLAGVVGDRLWLMRSRPALLGGGAAIGAGPLRRGGPRPVGVERQMALFARQLDLTADQQEALRGVFERWNVRAAALQVEAREQFAAEQLALLTEIEGVLTPEQVEQFRSTALIGRGGRLPALGGGERGGPGGPARGGPGRGPGGRGRE